MATAGRIKRRFYLHTAMEWVLLRDRDGATRKIRIVPKQRALTWKDSELSPAKHFVRSKDTSDEGLPVFLEMTPSEVFA